MALVRHHTCAWKKSQALLDDGDVIMSPSESVRAEAGAAPPAPGNAPSGTFRRSELDVEDAADDDEEDDEELEEADDGLELVDAPVEVDAAVTFTGASAVLDSPPEHPETATTHAITPTTPTR